MKNVLTRDLVLTIKNKFRIRLALKIVQLIRGLEDEFLTELLKILYDDEKNQLVVLGEKDIIPPLSEIVYRTDIPILSFDDVFSKELNSPLLFNIDTSRQIEDYDRRTFSVGPRFGAKDIFHQLQKVRRFIGDSRRTPIALQCYCHGLRSKNSLCQHHSGSRAEANHGRIKRNWYKVDMSQ